MPPNRTSLTKGSACTNCRHRKIRCDGRKPRCGPCLSSSGAYGDCEYSDFRTTELQSLEGQVSVLEARLQELETGQGSSSNSIQRNDLQETGSEVYLYPPSTAGQLSASGFEDLPPILHEILMHNFIHKTCSIGFFLHKEQFRKSVFQKDPTRPTFALLNTSYLWGMHLSSSRNSPGQEVTLISRALQSSAHALSEYHPQKVLQCIQSEVLLANYFYRADRAVEGRYHAAAAASLVLSSGMFKFRSSSPSEAFGNVWASNAIEEGERINGFWAVLSLDIFWNTVYGIPSSIPYTTSMVTVDAPWPRLMDEYIRDPFDPQFQCSHTIQRFLLGIPDENNSPKALNAKAAILFERAAFTGRQLKDDPTSQQHQATFNVLDVIIQRLIGSLLPLHRGSSPPLDYQLCMNSLVHAAVIQLHLHFSENIASRVRILEAAKTIVDLASDWSHVPEMDFIDPMLAIIWALCCQVFLDESARLNARENVSLPYAPAEIRTLCERMMATMEARPFPLMSYVP